MAHKPAPLPPPFLITGRVRGSTRGGSPTLASHELGTPWQGARQQDRAVRAVQIQLRLLQHAHLTACRIRNSKPCPGEKGSSRGAVMPPRLTKGAPGARVHACAALIIQPASPRGVCRRGGLWPVLAEGACSGSAVRGPGLVILGQEALPVLSNTHCR